MSQYHALQLQHLSLSSFLLLLPLVLQMHIPLELLEGVALVLTYG